MKGAQTGDFSALPMRSTNDRCGPFWGGFETSVLRTKRPRSDLRRFRTALPRATAQRQDSRPLHSTRKQPTRIGRARRLVWGYAQPHVPKTHDYWNSRTATSRRFGKRLGGLAGFMEQAQRAELGEKAPDHGRLGKDRLDHKS